NYNPPPHLTVALLDIGAAVMTINVVRGTTSIFTRDISAGGNQYTDLLQKELDMTFDQAESVKRGVHFEAQGADPQPAIDSVTEMLALEISRTLDFFRATAVDSPNIDRMLVAGGSSKVANLDKFPVEKFQEAVGGFDAFRSIRFGQRKLDDEYMKEISTNMAVGVGVGVRVAEVAK